MESSDSSSSLLSKSPTESGKKQLSDSDEINPPHERELESEMNSSVMSAILADVGTVSTITTAPAATATSSGGSSQNLANRQQEIKIEKEDYSSGEQVSSDSGLVVPVSQEGEKRNEEKHRPGSVGDGDGDGDGKALRGSRKRKRKAMEREHNDKWASRREASPKRKKVMDAPV